jgi:hypothetical protein
VLIARYRLHALHPVPNNSRHDSPYLRASAALVCPSCFPSPALTAEERHPRTATTRRLAAQLPREPRKATRCRRPRPQLHEVPGTTKRPGGRAPFFARHQSSPRVVTSQGLTRKPVDVTDVTQARVHDAALFVLDALTSTQRQTPRPTAPPCCSAPSTAPRSPTSSTPLLASTDFHTRSAA